MLDVLNRLQNGKKTFLSVIHVDRGVVNLLYKMAHFTTIIISSR